MQVTVPAALGRFKLRLHLLHIRRDWPRDRTETATLSAPERERASRFRFDADARRFVLGRLAIRRLLAEIGGLAPEALEITADKLGKPTCPQLPGWSFNLSHSGDFVLIGLSPQHPIGVDVEAHATPFPLDIAPLLGRREADLIAEAPAEQAARLFYSFWTIKEAALKALGCGLAVPPEEVRLCNDPSRHQGMNWQSCPWSTVQAGSCFRGLAGEVPAAQGYSAAVALLPRTSDRLPHIQGISKPITDKVD